MFSVKQSKASSFTCLLTLTLMAGALSPAWSTDPAASIGTPTVINRGNVGHEILEAAGQTHSTAVPVHRAGRGGTRSYSKKRIAHWKTQYWNGKNAATAKVAK